LFIILFGAVMYAALITLLTIGLSLCYLTTKVFNFAHTMIAVVGAYITITVMLLWEQCFYFHLYLQFIIGGIFSVVFYFFVMRKLAWKKVPDFMKMCSTLALGFVIEALLNIYADILERNYSIQARWAYLFPYRLIGGQTGLLIVVITLTCTICIGLHLLLTKTKFGIGLRAAVENRDLARTLGINVDLAYAFSWFLAGSLACLAGAFFPFVFIITPDVGWPLFIPVCAAGILGGLSIYGTMLGGFIIGLTEVLGTYSLSCLLGSWVSSYRTAIPLIILITTLLLTPKGLTSVDLKQITRFFKRFKGTVSK